MVSPNRVVKKVSDCEICSDGGGSPPISLLRLKNEHDTGEKHTNSCQYLSILKSSVPDCRI